jgi:hypothetical protein
VCDGFSNKRKAGNLLSATITTLCSLEMGKHADLWGHTCIPSYVGVNLQIFASPGTGMIKKADSGLENKGCQIA